MSSVYTILKSTTLESNMSHLFYRNTFYWDKHAYAIAAGDYTKARIRHWLHQASATGHALESSKAPLENRVWFTYPGQQNPLHLGTLDTPNAIGRVLDDGTTQLTQFTFYVAAVVKPSCVFFFPACSGRCVPSPRAG